MTTIAILSERSGENEATYRAVAGDKKSVGRTPGEALDALTLQLGDDEAGTLVIVQNLRPDRFFTAEQQRRLAELMTRWRDARDAKTGLLPQERAELEALIEDELRAARLRAETALCELEK